ncbi:hypothetical protein HZB06_00990 [Candidatus Wolfebacteria bacterium]|nr:hypothetical protein [Candidatus Wolfebacteria bacterium]
MNVKNIKLIIIIVILGVIILLSPRFIITGFMETKPSFFYLILFKNIDCFMKFWPEEGMSISEIVNTIGKYNKFLFLDVARSGYYEDTDNSGIGRIYFFKLIPGNEKYISAGIETGKKEGLIKYSSLDTDYESGPLYRIYRNINDKNILLIVFNSPINGEELLNFFNNTGMSNYLRPVYQSNLHGDIPLEMNEGLSFSLIWRYFSLKLNPAIKKINISCSNHINFRDPFPAFPEDMFIK